MHLRLGLRNIKNRIGGGIMEKEQLEIKRAELKVYLDNFNLSSEAVVKKAREFEDLANKVYGIKDGVYWMERAKKMEGLLQEVLPFCPAGYKHEIERSMEIEQ
jgi:hypothetical protein